MANISQLQPNDYSAGQPNPAVNAGTPPTGAPAPVIRPAGSTVNINSLQPSDYGVSAPTQDQNPGPLFNTTPQDAINPGTGVKIAAKTVGNVVPDFLKTVFWDLPVGVAKQVFGAIPKEALGLVTDQPQNVLTPEAQARAAQKGLPTGPTGNPIVGAIGDFLGVLTDPNPSEQVTIAKGMLQSLVPSAAQKVAQGDFTGAAQDIANHPFQQIAPFLITADEINSKVNPEAPSIISKIAEPVTAATGKVGAPLIDAIQNHYYNQAVSDWEKPTTIPKAAFNKPTDIFTSAADRGTNVGETLVDNGIRLEDNITKSDTGRTVYDTADTATKLREDTMTMSNEMLRPSLQMADQGGAPKAPVSDLVQGAIDRITSNNSIPAETKATIIKNIQATEEPLTSQYPGGMGLENLQDEKITRDLNAKYSPVGDIATNNEAIKNKALADSARALLEKNAPSDIPIREFNKELSSQYRAADYLDALHGKSVPQSFLSRMAATGAKLGGAVVGNLFGGGLISSYAGYQFGGMIERFIEGMPNAIKTKVLDNLEQTNPEAFQKIQSYLDAQKTAQAARLQLPAPAEPKTTVENGVVKISSGPTIILPEFKGSTKSRWMTQEQAQEYLKSKGVSGAGPWKKIEITDESGKSVSIPIRKPLNLRPNDETLRLKKQTPVKVPVQKG